MKYKPGQILLEENTGLTYIVQDVIYEPSYQLQEIPYTLSSPGPKIIPGIDLSLAFKPLVLSEKCLRSLGLLFTQYETSSPGLQVTPEGLLSWLRKISLREEDPDA